MWGEAHGRFPDGKHAFSRPRSDYDQGGRQAVPRAEARSKGDLVKKQQKKTIKKLKLMKETLAGLEQASGGTVYYPQRSDWYYCSRGCPIQA